MKDQKPEHLGKRRMWGGVFTDDHNPLAMRSKLIQTTT